MRRTDLLGNVRSRCGGRGMWRSSAPQKGPAAGAVLARRRRPARLAVLHRQTISALNARSSQLLGSGTSAARPAQLEDERTKLYDNSELVQQQQQIMRSGCVGVMCSFSRGGRARPGSGQDLTVADATEADGPCYRRRNRGAERRVSRRRAAPSFAADMLDNVNDAVDTTTRRLVNETEHTRDVSEKAKTGGAQCAGASRTHIS